MAEPRGRTRDCGWAWRRRLLPYPTSSAGGWRGGPCVRRGTRSGGRTRRSGRGSCGSGPDSGRSAFRWSSRCSRHPETTGQPAGVSTPAPMLRRAPGPGRAGGRGGSSLPLGGGLGSPFAFDLLCPLTGPPTAGPGAGCSTCLERPSTLMRSPPAAGQRPDSSSLWLCTRLSPSFSSIARVSS